MKSDILFACDLDNTLLYSHKRVDDISPANWKCVEFYQNHEQSFISRTSLKLIQQIRKHVYFVPTTTRSIEQFHRILWDEICEQVPDYALVANGAILLRDGQVDKDWRDASQQFVQPYMDELELIEWHLSKQRELLHTRMIDEMFLFAACNDTETSDRLAKEYRKLTKELTIQSSGRKIYFFPPHLDKGYAIRRLKESIKTKYVIAAGDSQIDIPMLAESNIFFSPDKNLIQNIGSAKGKSITSGVDFSDEFLKQIQNILLQHTTF